MNQTDYAQIHAAVTRCTSELRGIAFRLTARRGSDAAAGRLIYESANGLHALIVALQRFRPVEPREIERETTK